MLTLVLGPKLLGKMARWPFFFGSWARIGQAIIDFKDHMTTMVIEEKTAIEKQQVRSATFTNSLIRASENNEAGKGGGLTEEEIYGNLFVYNFAGHDTTATTFNWAIYLLAAFPEVQDWISEEIHNVCGNQDPETLDFKETYPRLVRCLAVFVSCHNSHHSPRSNY